MKVSVVVKTGRKRELVEMIDGKLIVHLTSRPVHNKANKELISLLSKRFKTRARIVSGLASKRKLVELLDRKEL